VNRRPSDLLHPRLTVVPVDGRSRPVDPAPGRTVVGQAELSAAMEVVAERRRSRLRERIATLEAERHDLLAAQAEADAAVAQRRADRDGFVAAADWCEALPAEVASGAATVAAAEADLADRLRTARDAARGLDRVLDQRASAEAAIAEARRQLAALRADGTPGPERERAAEQLAAQAAAVEAKLTEAEHEARARSEQAKREVSELERDLERLGRDQRDRLARLAALVECLPGEARPPHGDDPVAHAGTVAAGLRGLAAVVDAELAGLQAEADRRQAAADTHRRHLDVVRGSLERIVPEDAAAALADLVTGVADGVVVLDGVVAEASADDGLLRALEEAEPSAPLVLLSADPTVLGWAIDLPADRGALASPRTVDLLTDLPTTTGTCADRAPGRQHATTATGDHP